MKQPLKDGCYNVLNGLCDKRATTTFAPNIVLKDKND